MPKFLMPKFLLGIGVFASGMLAALVVSFHKLGAEWFGLPVVLFGFVASGLVGFTLTRFRWYQNPSRGLSHRMVALLVVAIFLAPILGVFFTEPIEVGGNLTQSDVAFRDYDYHDTRMGGWYYVHVYSSNVGSSSSSSSSSSGSIDLGDDAGEALAYLFIVLVVVVIVLASAFVPHFWVVALMILITLSVLLALREGRVEEYQVRYRDNQQW